MGQDDVHQFNDVGDAELLHDVVAMVFDSAVGAMEDMGDMAIAFSLDDEL